MSTQKRQSHNVGDAVINQHQENCIKLCLTDIQVTKSQSGMETQQSTYCLSISLLFIKIGHKNWLAVMHVVAD